MNTQHQRYTLTALALAAQSVFGLAALAATEDEAVTAQTQPVSSVEIGVGTVNRDSAKFGEYNGLGKKGAYGIGAFELASPVRDDSTLRYRLRGSNLGLNNRNVTGDIGEQGRYRVDFMYDELERRYSDSYQTPYLGAGSTTLTLPSSFPAVATRLSSTTTAAGLLSNWNNIQSPYGTAAAATVGGASLGQPAAGSPAAVITGAMHAQDISTKRTRLDFGSTLTLGRWDLRVAMREDTRDGVKLTGVAFGGQRGALLPEPIQSATHQIDASAAYVDPRTQVTLSYTASAFDNLIGLWTAQNPFANNALLDNLARLSAPPSNQMHQWAVNGGHSFGSTTRLAFSASESVLTQNAPFIPISPVATTWSVPVASANARVVNTQLLARLTARPVQGLSLLASYKYDDRKNETPALTFQTAGADGTGGASVYTTEPQQRRTQTALFEADYALGRGRGVKGGFEWQQIQRRGQEADETPFRAEFTRESTWRIEYRDTASEFISARLSFAHGMRKPSDYEPGDASPATNPAPQPAADPELPTFRQFWLADRQRDKLRGSVLLQPAGDVSLQAGVDATRDRYTASQYGTKEVRLLAANVDGNYAPGETWAFNAFYTYESNRSQIDSLAISRYNAGTAATTTANGFTYLYPHVSGGSCAAYASNIGQKGTTFYGGLPADYYNDPCRAWSEVQSDKVHTLGLGAKARNLMGDRLELAADVSYARAVTPINVSGGAYFSNGLPGLALNNVWIAAQSLPDITSSMTEIRLGARYAIDKTQALRLNVLNRRLRSADWQYDAYAANPLAMQAYIGSAITSPNYNVTAVGISYIVSFR